MRYVMLLTFWTSLTLCKAVPAYPFPLMVKTSTGSYCSIYLQGDEYCKFAFSEDGYTLLHSGDVWKYATYDTDGNMVMSEHELVPSGEETENLIQFKKNNKKGIIPYRFKFSLPAAHRSPRTTGGVPQPVIGEKHSLVILMQFPDVSFNYSSADFNLLFNEIHSDNVETKNKSVRDYYRQASNGKLDYQSDIYGPFTASLPLAFYGRNANNGGMDENVIQLYIEAVRCLPKDIDLSRYDNDNDGSVDNVHIIFAGHGEEAGASSDAIWSHESNAFLAMKSEYGYNFKGYTITPELQGNTSTKITNIGVCCHELGHALGAMDYYDTNYAVNGSFLGTGQWDIMAQGSWNDMGASPAYFNPYVRCAFGWNEIKTISSEGKYIVPVVNGGNGYNEVFRINTESPDDYFLIENRDLQGFDLFLPGAGLMIYHVHPKIGQMENAINAAHPQGFYPVCAGGHNIIFKDYGDINSPSCPFPGTEKVTTFKGEAWNGLQAHFLISDIQRLDDGTIQFWASQNGITEERPDSDRTKYECLYKESFEGKINEDVSITADQNGSLVWTIYGPGCINTQANLIPHPTDGESLLMLFSGKTNTMSMSQYISEDISLSSADQLLFSMDYSVCTMDNKQASSLCLKLMDDDKLLESIKLQDTERDLETFSLPFRLAGNSLKFILSGEIYSYGVFVDNIRIEKPQVTANIEESKSCISYQYSNNLLIVKSSEYGRVIIHDMLGMKVADKNIVPGENHFTLEGGKFYFISNTINTKKGKLFCP